MKKPQFFNAKSSKDSIHSIILEKKSENVLNIMKKNLCYGNKL